MPQLVSQQSCSTQALGTAVTREICVHEVLFSLPEKDLR